jgi:exonuclease SbcC
MIKSWGLVLLTLVVFILGFALAQFHGLLNTQKQSRLQYSENPTQEQQLAGRTSSTKGATNHTQQDQIKKQQASIQSKITANEQRIADIESKLSEAPNRNESVAEQSQDLQEKIQQQKNTIAALEAEAGNNQTNLASRQRAIEFQASQASQINQQSIAVLQQEIVNQQNILNRREVELKYTVAPDDSVLITQGKAAVAEAQDRLNSLKNQYGQVLERERDANQARADLQNQLIQEQQAGQVDIRVSLSSAQSNLQQLIQQDQKTTNESQDSQKETEKLKNEYQQLLSENQKLKQSL